MPPIDLLGILLLITIGGVAAERWSRRRAQAVYRQLAVEHRMHYSSGDPLRLTARVAARLPMPGAAGVRVIDLMYRTDEQNHYYVFTAEYTVGVVGPKHRVRRAAAFTESKTGAGIQNPIHMGPEELTWVEQYRALFEK
jgi:hypothetical protein